MRALVVYRSFVGVDADVWAAAGVWLGPLLAVVAGLLVFRYQQGMRDAQQRFLTDGIQRLDQALSKLLWIHMQNYQVATYIIRTLKLYERDHPLAPDPDEFGRFAGLDLESVAIESTLPVQELIGDKVVLDWVMHAVSDVTLEAKEGDSQIRQPIEAYYRSEKPVELPRDEAVRRLGLILEAWNSRIERHFALLDRLYDLDRHLGRKPPWTVRGYYAVWKRSKVGEIREKMQSQYKDYEKVHEETARVMKSGEATA